MNISKAESFGIVDLTREEATDLAQFLLDMAPFGETGDTLFSKIYFGLKEQGINIQGGDQQYVYNRAAGEARRHV